MIRTNYLEFSSSSPSSSLLRAIHTGSSGFPARLFSFPGSRANLSAFLLAFNSSVESGLGLNVESSISFTSSGILRRHLIQTARSSLVKPHPRHIASLPGILLDTWFGPGGPAIPLLENTGHKDITQVVGVTSYQE